MKTKPLGYLNMRMVIGLLIIAAGILLLLDSLDVTSDFNVGDYWPVILIVIGLGKVLQPKRYRQIYWGVVFMAIGALFLLNNLGYIRFWFDDLWPIILILIGIEILRLGLFKKKFRMGCCGFQHKERENFKGWAGISDSNDVDKDYIDVSVILGGGKYTFMNKKLKGGTVSAIMGGCELDLKNAEMEQDRMILETSAIMGGIEVRVPTHWQVIIEGSPILGSMEDKTAKAENPTKKLILKGASIMGGVEVKN